MNHENYYRVVDLTDAQDMGVYSTSQLCKELDCTWKQIHYAEKNDKPLLGRFIIARERQYKEERTPKFVYIKVSNDKYELPLEMADTVIELAEKCRINKSVIYRSLKVGGRYKRVNIN